MPDPMPFYPAGSTTTASTVSGHVSSVPVRTSSAARDHVFSPVTNHGHSWLPHWTAQRDHTIRVSTLSTLGQDPATQPSPADHENAS